MRRDYFEYVEGKQYEGEEERMVSVPEFLFFDRRLTELSKDEILMYIYFLCEMKCRDSSELNFDFEYLEKFMECNLKDVIFTLECLEMKGFIKIRNREIMDILMCVGIEVLFVIPVLKEGDYFTD